MQIEAHVRQFGRTTAQGVARSHHVLIDRPTEKGGADEGMMGGEYLLVALGGCLMSNFIAAALAREADIQNARARIVGTLAGNPSHFERIEIIFGADGVADALLHKLVEIADRGCIVANTLRGAVDLRVLVEQDDKEKQKRPSQPLIEIK